MKKKNLLLCRPVLLACFVLILSLATASAQRQHVSVRADNATVGNVIQSLKQQTGLDFFYSNAQVDVNRRVTLNLASVELDQALRRLLGNTFSFEYNDNVVIIKPAPETSHVIAGIITDADGKPIVGASVYVKGNSRVGTISDMQGHYLLALANVSNPVIVVTFVGMKPHEFAPAGGNHNVVLEEAANQITPVNITVSTGYQDIPRDRMTGAYSTITAKELESSNFMSLDQALEGKVAGLYSSTPSGEPGVRAQIRIRGDNTISGNKEPLWVVDGLPLQQGVATIEGLTSGDLQQSILNHGVGNIAPSDIESVTILKDAAATAIYGARAAAGVIVVKTKKGREGPIVINYQGNFSLGEAPTQQLNFMNAAEKIQYEIELAEQFGNTDRLGRAAWIWDSWQRGDISTDEYNRTLAEMRAVNVDWFDEIYRTSFSQSHNVSMRGGSDKMWFYGTVNAQNEKGILKSNTYDKFSASISSGYRPAEKLLIDFKVEGYYRETNNHNSAIDPFRYAVFANPYEKAYNDDGSYAWDVSYGVTNRSDLHSGMQFERFNILNEMKNTGKKSIATDLTATLSVNWQITESLKAEAYGRIGYSVSQTEAYADKGTYTSWSNYLLKNAFTATGSSTELPNSYNNGYISGSTGRSPSYSMRAGLSYNRDINASHFLNVYVGGEIRSSESWSNSFRTVNYDNQYYFTGFPELSWNPPLDKYLWAELNKMSAYVYGNKDRYVSFFGTFTYSFQDRYVVNANARFDGAGTIHADNRFTPLWSVSARWNLHKEDFIRDNLPFLSEFAIRGVFGYTGQIDKRALPFPYISLGSGTWDSEYYAQNVYFPNPGIKWEKKRERSIGLDYALFNNVFGGSVNYYNNKTEDLLDQTIVANSFGNTSPKMNKGSLTNKGFEFHFNLRLQLGEVRWLTSFNVSRNTNKITDTYYKDPSTYSDNAVLNIWGGFSGSVEGYPNGTIFGHRIAGVNPATGNPLIILSDKSRELLAEKKGVEVGEIGYAVDLEDGDLSNAMIAYSLSNLGNSNPKYYGGFSTTVQWKGLELRANFSYATDRMLRSFDERDHTFMGGYTSGQAPKYSELYAARLNRLKTAKNRWRAPGDITDYPRYSSGSTRYYFMTTEDKYEKAGYLKFQDISLNYSVKARFMEAIGLTSLRIGLQVSNIATWSKFTGFDASTGNAFAYPQQRRYMLNMQLSF